MTPGPIRVSAPPCCFFKVLATLLAAAMLLIASQALAGDRTPALRHFGYAEEVLLMEGSIRLKAKLDTGADHSSVHAPEYRIFEKDGRTWVRFTVAGENGRAAHFERPMIYMARIKQRSSPNAVRPVVMMKICLGDRVETAAVNLADRSGLTYPMLIGRSLLETGILVDSSKQFTTPPDCNASGDQEEAP